MDVHVISMLQKGGFIVAQRHVFFDKTELVLGFPQGKKFVTMNLTYNQITRIQFDKCTEFKFFRKVPSEKITIVTPKRGEPIVYTKLKEKNFFEEYKAGFEKFARENRITFQNNLDSAE
jgi:hypothetical protein